MAYKLSIFSNSKSVRMLAIFYLIFIAFERAFFKTVGLVFQLHSKHKLLKEEQYEITINNHPLQKRYKKSLENIMF